MFSDVTYEIKPVSAGRRLVLTCQLVHSTLGPEVLSAGSNKSMAKLDLSLSYWKINLEDELSLMAHMLDDDEVTRKPSRLSYEALQGQNAQIVKYLQDAGEKHKFCIYLASLKR